MNLKRLNDDLTETIARSLHYLENQDEIFSMETSAEVRAAVEGGVERYLNEPAFAAKVKSLVAQVMICVQIAAGGEGRKE